MFAKMNITKLWEISYSDFVKLIMPSFTAVDEAEDLDAILARTHLIVLSDNGIYHRVASTGKGSVPFIAWDNEPKDLLVPSQHAIYKSYKMNPQGHQLPPSFHEDSAWSQEALRRLINGEQLPRGYIVYRPRSMIGDARHLCCKYNILRVQILLIGGLLRNIFVCSSAYWGVIEDTFVRIVCSSTYWGLFKIHSSESYDVVLLV